MEIKLFEILVWLTSTAVVGFVSSLLTLKATKKKKEAEAVGAEMSNLLSVIGTYESLLKKTEDQSAIIIQRAKEEGKIRDERIENLEKEVDNLRKLVTKMMEENNILRLINNEAYKCQFDFRQCPVIALKQNMLNKKEDDNGQES